MRHTLRASLFLALTLLTQIGGLAYLLTQAISRRRIKNAHLTSFALFAAIYVAGVLLCKIAAPVLGRVPLPCFSTPEQGIAVRSPLFCLMNRNYVTPQMLRAATAFSVHMAQTYPGTVTLALDANFPFLDVFPLLPHLSHDDGRKLDLAFYYEEQGSYLAGKTKSPVGYFSFEQPTKSEPQPCLGRRDWLTLRWDFSFLQPFFPRYSLEPARMTEAIRWLANEGEQFGVEKIFVEPHIAKRLGVFGERIRFQGCRAARHDDHLHFQIH